MEDVLKKEKAYQEVLTKLKKMPDDPKLNSQIAIFYLQRQQLDKAMPISEKMPDDVDLNRAFGIYYLGKDQMEKALKISEMMPDDVELNTEFALAYLKKANIKDALTFSEKVIAKDPENESGLLPKLHTQIGLAYAMQLQRKPEDANLVKNAEMHFKKVVDMYPKSDEYEDAQYFLGVTYMLSKQYDKATEVLEKLVNHTTSEQIKLRANTVLQRLEQLPAEGETDN